MKKNLCISLLLVFVTHGYSQKYIERLDSLTNGFYASVHISDSHFYATTELDEKEYVYEFTFVDSVWQQNLFWEGELATGGLIDLCPYFYSRQYEDLIPLYPEYPEFSAVDADEVWVTGTDSMIFIIADYDHQGSLDIYEINLGQQPTLSEKSDLEIDEHGIFLANDSLFFSRYENNNWTLYSSSLADTTSPHKMSELYNQPATSTIYYSQLDDKEYFSMEDSIRGIYTFYAEEIKIVETETTEIIDTLSTILMKDTVNNNSVTYGQAIKKDSWMFHPSERFEIIDPEKTNVSDSTRIIEHEGQYYAVPDSSQFPNLSEIEGETLTKAELVKVFDYWGYTTVYTQVGLYTKNNTTYFETILSLEIKTMKKFFKNKNMLRHYVPAETIENALNDLEHVVSTFSAKKINDTPFIYIGRGTKTFQVITLSNNKFIVTYYNWYLL